MILTDKEIINKLTMLLDDCMSSANQEYSIKITSVTQDDDGLSGKGMMSFTWCIPEPENKEPYFVGY